MPITEYSGSKHDFAKIEPDLVKTCPECPKMDFTLWLGMHLCCYRITFDFAEPLLTLLKTCYPRCRTFGSLYVVDSLSRACRIFDIHVDMKFRKKCITIFHASCDLWKQLGTLKLLKVSNMLRKIFCFFLQKKTVRTEPSEADLVWEENRFFIK